mgnify:FL=1
MVVLVVGADPQRVQRYKQEMRYKEDAVTTPSVRHAPRSAHWFTKHDITTQFLFEKVYKTS